MWSNTMSGRAVSGILLALGLLLACTTGISPQPSPAPAIPPASPPNDASVAGGPAATSAASSRPALPTTPRVALKVGTVPFATNAPFFIAQERGYFTEVGLDVEFASFNSVTQQVPALAQGQLHVGSCASNAACFNALQRGTDIRIVADLTSAGKTERSTGNTALVVRKDLWDDGTIRGASDLVGRTVYLVPGPGGGDQPTVALWLQRNGVDPAAVDWEGMPFPDQLAAMENHAIEVGIQTEPLVTAGLSRGTHVILATQEAMDPNAQLLYVAYWSGIERLGPRVGERFLVAFLRGARDYLDAFEYGMNQDAAVDVLTRETLLKDPTTYRQIKYSWVDPNGIVNQASLEARAGIFRELGVLNAPVDLAQAIDDRYRQFAVNYLGEYRPPR